MKKLFLFAAVLFAAVTVSAQEKGDMYLSGTFRLSAGKTVNSIGNTTTNTPGTTSFSIIPKFGIFVIDNLEVNAGVGYGLSKVNNNRAAANEQTLYNNTNTFYINVGTNYFVMLADNFYYTPGVRLSAGFGSQVNQLSATEKQKEYNNTSFTFSIPLCKFEYRVSGLFGVALEAGSLDVSTTSQKRTAADGTVTKRNTTNFSWDINTGAAISFKFYF